MTAQDANAVGIVDWGIGGLGFYRSFRARHPGAPILYWSDTGATPYGKLPRAALARRLEAVVGALAAKGASRVVVACNAASTVAGAIATPVPVAGIVDAGVAAAVAAADARGGAAAIGVTAVIGGARTIRSGVYRRALSAAGHRVVQRIAQPLSALVEAGRVSGPELESTLAAILSPLRGAELLLLACTHYPAVAARIAAHLPGTHLVDPVDRLVAQIAGMAPTAPLAARAGPGRDRFFTTGDPDAMRTAARAAFGLALPKIEPAGLRLRTPAPART